jgi:hypothetical protein
MKGERWHRSAALERGQGGLNVELERQTMEVERQVASESTQALVRAEATVSGAGREAVEPLMEEATLSIGTVEVQEGRVLLDGHGSVPADTAGRGGQAPRAGCPGAISTRPSKRRGPSPG